jgi:hypothetical protein
MSPVGRGTEDPISLFETFDLSANLNNPPNVTVSGIERVFYPVMPVAAGVGLPAITNHFRSHAHKRNQRLQRKFVWRGIGNIYFDKTNLPASCENNDI